MTEYSPDRLDEVANRISALVKARAALDPVKVIVIEGEDGAGKTSFAIALAQILNAKHVELDSYLRARKYEREPFVDLVDMTAFVSAIQSSPLVVVDGVLISDVLSAASIGNDLRVYVRRISQYGFWNYGLDLARGHLLEIPDAPPSMLDEEIFEYHQRRLPHQCANLFFNRI